MSRRGYENALPIADDLVVLDLLYDDRWEWKIERRLHIPHPNLQRSEEPYVRVARSEHSVLDFLVAPGVGERLLGKYLVEGKKHWGYTDDRDLSITDAGREMVRDAYERAGVRYDEHFTRRLRSERWIAETAP
jgi:hypothetical protein